MVARYSKYGSDNHFIDRNGKWVKFEDYQNLDFKLQELEAELRKYKDQLRKYKDQYPDYAELERKLRNFADQVLYAPCSKVTEEMAMEILGL